MIERFVHDGRLLALVVRKEFLDEGVLFFTPPEFSQQLAFMAHPSGRRIAPHVHNPVGRKVTYTQEVLFLRKGRLRVDFYTQSQEYLESSILEGGDIILLAEGGHGFTVLEDIEMFEVKQGPYAGDEDKTRFHGVEDHMVSLVRRSEKQ